MRNHGSTLLIRWQKACGHTSIWVARKLRVDSTLVSTWRRRRRIPTVRQQLRLALLTFGAVPTDSWARP